MEKVQIIPPPKDVDPQVLVWKGAAVLGKMDGASELWVTPQDWVTAAWIDLLYECSLTACVLGRAWDERTQRTLLLPLNVLRSRLENVKFYSGRTKLFYKSKTRCSGGNRDVTPKENRYVCANATLVAP